MIASYKIPIRIYIIQYAEDGSGSGDYEDDNEYSDQNSDPDPDCHKKDKVQMTALYYCPQELGLYFLD